MNFWKTELDVLTTSDIESYIIKHKSTLHARFDMLYDYYRGKNVKILDKPKDSDNPDNRTPVSYARKIITTFTGYAYRPKYITYKPADDSKKEYYKQLQNTFDLNNEPIKTHVSGRNTGIYGVAYELLYIDRVGDLAEPKFFNVDPEEIILLYDFSPEPKPKIGIRYYEIDDDYYKVEVYYKSFIVYYDRKRSNSGKWEYTQPIEPEINFFEDIQIVPYFFGDDCLGVIEPVLPLIDDYDEILSGSITEFERFANSYLKLVGMTMGGSQPNDESQVRKWLARLRKSRTFENLKDKDSVSFLTKDIPKDFIEFMTNHIHDQIHTQSSVPDFAAFKDVSGEAIKRLMFDFENVVSSAEADFDTGLYKRISLINTIYRKAGRIVEDPASIVITHKRNIPFSLKESAETAKIMKEAGFSRQTIIEIMPDEIVPDEELELKRQIDEATGDIPNVDTMRVDQSLLNNDQPMTV